jgi:adenylosuccinate synthase
LAPETVAVLPAGAIIDPEIFLREVGELGLGPERVIISPFASVITTDDRDAERSSGIIGKIGSTGSGTGAALVRRIARQAGTRLAGTFDSLKPFVQDAVGFMRSSLNQNRWIVIEGSQGFGLSLLHGSSYPYATSRDTTAGTFLGEAGLSPVDVKDVTLVLRAHPIRVAGNSGPLLNETTWELIARTAGLPDGYNELTTATRKIRRVGQFDSVMARRAIEVNNPTRIVLNHFDYVDPDVRRHQFNFNAQAFLKKIESDIDREIDFVGTGPATLIPRREIGNSELHPTAKYSRHSD